MLHLWQDTTITGSDTRCHEEQTIHGIRLLTNTVLELMVTACHTIYVSTSVNLWITIYVSTSVGLGITIYVSTSVGLRSLYFYQCRSWDHCLSLLVQVLGSLYFYQCRSWDLCLSCRSWDHFSLTSAGLGITSVQLVGKWKHT